MQQGFWRGHLELAENIELPFVFEVISANRLEVLGTQVSDNTQIKFFNADEVIPVDDVSYVQDSIFIRFPVYESEIKAVFVNDSMIQGSFIKSEVNRIVPFKAVFNNKTRFEAVQASQQNVTGNWETVFGTGDDTYLAKGIFKQEGSKVTGTFRTETGDYRYLEGVMDGDTMKLSAFDGSFAFLFTATVKDSVMNGMFYSGNHYKTIFTAKRNDNFELADETTLTRLKDGYDSIDFSFPDANGKLVSLSDKQFKSKVVIVQILGSWCPNCLDESRYFSEYIANNKDKDVAFVALAFEYAKTEEAAFRNIKRLQTQVGIDYPVLLAQYGGSDRAKAQEKLPMLDGIKSYPTTIFIDKTGKVRKIHTGFNGPATGEKYVAFKKEFEEFVRELVRE